MFPILSAQTQITIPDVYESELSLQIQFHTQVTSFNLSLILK